MAQQPRAAQRGPAKIPSRQAGLHGSNGKLKMSDAIRRLQQVASHHPFRHTLQRLPAHAVTVERRMSDPAHLEAPASVASSALNLELTVEVACARRRSIPGSLRRSPGSGWAFSWRVALPGSRTATGAGDIHLRRPRRQNAAIASALNSDFRSANGPVALPRALRTGPTRRAPLSRRASTPCAPCVVGASRCACRQ
jgi:hypothetical protein